MLHFYSYVKVFGCYIIVTCVLSVSKSTTDKKGVRCYFNESGEIRYGYSKNSKYAPCEEENGLSTHVENITFPSSCSPGYIDLKKNNSAYKDLIDKVTIDCNGRPECTSSYYSGLNISRPTCQGSPANYTDIHFSCKPTRIDNITVFDISLNFELTLNKSKPAYYLVLRSHKNTNTHRHCKMDGITPTIGIKVLHVDFRLSSEVNQDSLHGNMTFFSSDNETCNYTWLPSVPFKIVDCNAKKVDIDIHMSTGFVWIELKGGKNFKLNCGESNSNNHDISHMPTTSGTTQAPTTITSVTTGNGSSTAKTNHSGSNTKTPKIDTTHSPSTNISVPSESGSNTTKAIDSRQSDVISNIVIAVSVAFLALLIVIVSFVFCVCRRNSRFQVWKRSRGESAHCDRRDDEYDNVPSHEDLDPTYNIVNALVATDAKKRTRPVSNTTKPRVPSTAQQTPLKPIKTPTPTDSSGPSRKVEQQGEGAPDGANGDLYATVNKVKKVEAAASSGTSTNHGNITQANMADSDGAEYSHLANFGKKRNYENIYNG